MKGYEERGLKQAGIKLIATGDITDDGVLRGDGGPDARAHHQLPLLGGAQFAGERGVQEGVQRGQR